MIVLDDAVVAAFAAAMRAAGIEPPTVIKADGKLHRFSTNGERHDDAGYYKLHVDGIPAGAFGDFRSGIMRTWCAREEVDLSPAERESHRRRVEAANREAEAERKREHREAATRAGQLWDAASPAGADHPYLVRKRVGPTTTLREMLIDHLTRLLGYQPKAKGEALAGRVLIAPVKTDGEFASLAMIDEAGRKPFLYGGAVKGGYWSTGELPEGDGESPTILIAEGVATAISAREATGHIAIAALSAGNMTAAARAVRERLSKAHLVMLADLDASGVGLAKATQAARAVRGLVAVPDFGEDRPTGAKDVNDLHVHRGLDAVRATIMTAKSPKLEAVAGTMEEPTLPGATAPAVDDDAELARLRRLTPLAYERERKAAAAKLGIERVSILDMLVKATRGEADVAGQGRPLEFPEPEPWPEPVDGTVLLREIAAAVARYIVMEPGSAECVALWAVHAHALDAFAVSPRLAVTSPRAGCGKTTLLDVLSHLVPRPLSTASISAAAIYRTIEAVHPTLLVDEADTFLVGNDEMRGVLNSGHRRGGTVVRVVGENYEPRQFTTWGACAVAMIGKLPGTLADRSIPIGLKRKRPDESVEQFRFDRTEDLDELARKAARWGKDNLARLRGMDPLVPESLSNRAADNWRVLLAIADAAGGVWSQRAREIAAATVDADQARRTVLLADIRDVFAAKGLDQISSADLVAALVEIEGHDWAEFRNGRPLTVNGLARLLKADAISPCNIRIGLSVPKGYRLAQFADAFERYLPTPQNQTATPLQTAETLGSPGLFEPLQPNQHSGSQSAGNPSNSADCSGVAVENGGAGDEEGERGSEEGCEEADEWMA